MPTETHNADHAMPGQGTQLSVWDSICLIVVIGPQENGVPDVEVVWGDSSRRSTTTEDEQRDAWMPQLKCSHGFLGLRFVTSPFVPMGRSRQVGGT